MIYKVKIPFYCPPFWYNSENTPKFVEKEFYNIKDALKLAKRCNKVNKILQGDKFGYWQQIFVDLVNKQFIVSSNGIIVGLSVIFKYE